MALDTANRRCYGWKLGRVVHGEDTNPGPEGSDDAVTSSWRWSCYVLKPTDQAKLRWLSWQAAKPRSSWQDDAVPRSEQRRRRSNRDSIEAYEKDDVTGNPSDSYGLTQYFGSNQVRDLRNLWNSVFPAFWLHFRYFAFYFSHSHTEWTTGYRYC